MRHSAITFRDKNKNSAHIACAFLYWRSTYSYYIDDKDSYEIMPNLSENLILSQWEKLVFLRAALLYTAGSKNTSGVLQDMVA